MSHVSCFTNCYIEALKDRWLTVIFNDKSSWHKNSGVSQKKLPEPGVTVIHYHHHCAVTVPENIHTLPKEG